MRFIAIDHVHIYVDDLDEAIQWYKNILSFEITPRFKFWFEQGGPLVINNGDAYLSLFKRTTQNRGNTVAFSVDRTSFLQFKEHLTSCNVPISVIDHEVSLSVYFTDPYDNKYEITTYDYFEL
ncbi:VOC family protein [Providencia stuartii]|uniref:VOC family protein n=1 Tax=Providencia TaxID=586 RepID=UPI00111FDADA|nr:MULTISPECIES: VOC family protein [Providencia]ELR5299122.1 VOC family protein [Providencia stuartii]MDV5225988.1 VOC family protein [Providencia rettgeri]MDW7587423.1 VOC family protein [Providencia sp. 2023EL-00965]